MSLSPFSGVFDRGVRGVGLLPPRPRITRNFAKKVRALIREAKDLKKEGRGPGMYDAMCAKMDAVLKYYDRHPEIKKYVGYVRNAGHPIFTFMNYDYVDSDNNLAERAMREVVKHRVMKSLLLTTGGAEIFAILLTVMMTYKTGTCWNCSKNTWPGAGNPAGPGRMKRQTMHQMRPAGRRRADTADAGPAAAGRKRDFVEYGWRMHA